MPTVDQYFGALAAFATQELAQMNPGVPAPPVFDGPQDPAATAWSALSIHPMSVMETSYIATVRAAEAVAGPDPIQNREAAFEALSGFFTLHKDAPTRLSPDSTPLIDETIREIETDFRQIEVLARQNPAETFARSTRLIAAVVDVLTRVTTPASIALASQDIQDLAAYLDFQNRQASQIPACWAQGRSCNTSGEARALVQEIETRIVTPLMRPSIAAASPRSLYNIGPFSLYRLMHRFQGGTASVEMNLDQKGKASGDVTGRMHRADWAWMAAWHQAKIDELNQEIAALNVSLRQELAPPGITEILRFFLKGGRAMYTMLGSPEQGTNDWDTGILINPYLRPEDWYKAYAQVNDLVVHFLDRARFSYTELLRSHAAELLDPMPFKGLLEAPTRRYSRAALHQEHTEETQLRLSFGGGPFRPSGVNGELIDIGISARNSIELLEHWRALTISVEDGIDDHPTPVPTLAFFVDDFSTIIREAIMANAVDRKLAKRLERLLLVFQSRNADFGQAVAQRVHYVTQNLPATAAAMSLSDSSLRSQMLAWGLFSLLESVSVFYLRQEWVTAFDTYIAGISAQLLDPQNIATMWAEIQPSIKDHAHDADCEALFLAENTVARVAEDVLADFQTKAQYTQTGAAEDAIKRFMQAVGGAYLSSDQGVLYRSGLFGLVTQAEHAQISMLTSPDVSLGGVMELFYRPGTLDSTQAFKNIARDSAGAIPQGFQISQETFHGREMLVLRSNVSIPNLNVTPANPAILIVCAEPEVAGKARVLDYISGAATASLRDLARIYCTRTALCDDFRLRTAGKIAFSYILDSLLGRQLME